MYDRRQQGPKRHRRTRRRGAVAKGASPATSPTCGLVFQKTLEAARGAIAQQPLALAVAHAIHGRTTIVATVRGGGARRFTHRLVTSRPSAKNLGMFVCCVTTRRRSGSCRTLPFLRDRGRRGLAFAAPPLRLGVLLASFSARTMFVLPLGRLPTPQFRQAFRLSTVRAGCDALPETSARNLCEDKSAIPAAGPWQAHRLRWYADSVPWEVLTPLGSPRRISLILLGHFALAPLSLSAPQPTTADEPLSPDVRTRTRRNRQDVTTRQAVARPRKQGRRLSRNALGSKDTDEGACPSRRGKDNQRRTLRSRRLPPARKRRQIPARATKKH